MPSTACGLPPGPVLYGWRQISHFSADPASRRRGFTLQMRDFRSGPSRAKDDGRPERARGVAMKIAHTGINGFQEALEQKEAELARSEEHTSELQSRQYLVCRLLLEKK